MIRLIVAFISVWAIVFLGISFFWHSPMSAKISLFKTGLYSLVTAIIAFAILVGIVILF